MASFSKIMSFLAGVLVSSFMLLTGHWFQWSYFLGTELPKFCAYIYGTVAIWSGFSVWRLLRGDKNTPLGLGIISIISGLVVAMAYFLDLVAGATATKWQDGKFGK